MTLPEPVFETDLPPCCPLCSALGAPGCCNVCG